MATSSSSVSSSIPMACDLASFVQSLQQSNPFRSNRVSSVPLSSSDSGILQNREDFLDVPEIHARAFRQLQRAIKDIRENRGSLGVMLTGGAGVGKSHLLARLCRWVESEGQACFVYLHNVMASPKRMSRHFLRSVISVLVEGRESFEDCTLYRMLNRTIKMLLHARQLPTRQVSRDQARQVFLEETSRLPLRFDAVNSQVFAVLYRFFEEVNLRPELPGGTKVLVHGIVDWLSGDPISEETAVALGLPLSTNTDEDSEEIRLQDEHHIEQVLLILSELARLSNRVLLICLDQFDNLDVEQVRELSRFLHTFIDHAHNLVLVTSGVSEKIEEIRNMDQPPISVAQWDRIGQKTVELHYCTSREARKLIDARLAPLRNHFGEVKELTQYFHDHAMFPLAEKDFEKRFGDSIEVRPRSALSWAGEAWQDMQDAIDDKGATAWLREWITGGSRRRNEKELIETDVIDEAVSKAIVESIADRRERPGSLPPDADNLATLSQKLLAICVDHPHYSIVSVKPRSRTAGRLPPYQLEVQERVANTTRRVVSGVSFITTTNGKSACAALTRLASEANSDLAHRILVTDEERAPLPTTKTANERYSALVNLGREKFIHIKLTFAQYVELDALRSAIDQAGDMMIEYPRGTYRALVREEVMESLHRQQRLLGHPLLKELLTEPTDAVGVVKPPPLSDELVKTVSNGLLGWKCSVTSNEVTKEILQRHEFSQLDFEVTHQQVLRVTRSMGAANQLLVKEHLNGVLLMKCF